jgi:cell division protein FtsB
LQQRGELGEQQSALARLEHDREELKRQLSALEQPEVLEARARKLGLIKPGEKSFIITGLEPPAPAPPPDDPGILGWLFG